MIQIHKHENIYTEKNHAHPYDNEDEKMIFESHAHYDDDWYDEDRESLLSSMSEQNVGKIVNVGASITSSKASLALAQAYENVYAAVGVHPDEILCLKQEGLDEIRRLAMEEKVVAIGEIGLDYFRKEACEYDYKALQKKWFLEQLELAWELQKPVIIHSRDAAEDTMHILTEFYKDKKAIEHPGVIHCYSYSHEQALTYVKMGFFIGVGGVVTFKNGKKLVEVVKQIPLSSILVETDSPYLSPEPFRGQRNQSGNIKYVIDKIAQIKEISPREVEEITCSNACDFYGLK